MPDSQNHIIDSSDLLEVAAVDGAGVIVLDNSHQVIWASDKAAKIFGFRSDVEIVGLNWHQLLQIGGNSVWSEEIETEFENEGKLLINGFCDGRDGRRICLSVSMRRLGEEKSRVVMLRDTTTEHQRSDEITRVNKETEKLNRALAEEISKANELAVLAERANIAKSVFLTSMSHEFRTPLNGVLGYAQLLKDDKLLSDDNRKAAGIIHKCGTHLLNLINDLLDLSKIDAGKVEQMPTPTNIPALCNEVLEIFRFRADRKSLRLDFVYPEEDQDFSEILVDAKLLKQVLINLVGNAIKFTDEGKVTLSLERSFLSDGKAEYSLSVEDTGPGIEEDYLEQIFEEFYQTEAFSGHKGGTGLGLAISRRIVDLIGGELQVKSDLGIGSNFHFSIESEVIRQNSVRNVRPACDPGIGPPDNQQWNYLYLGDSIADGGVLGAHFDRIGIAGYGDETVSSRYLIIISDTLMTEDLHDVLNTMDEAPERCLRIIVPSKTSPVDSDNISEVDCMKVFELPIDLAEVNGWLMEATRTNWENAVEERLTTTDIEERKAEEGFKEIPLGWWKELIENARMGDITTVKSSIAQQELIDPDSNWATEMALCIDQFQVDKICLKIEETIRNLTV